MSQQQIAKRAMPPEAVPQPVAEPALPEQQSARKSAFTDVITTLDAAIDVQRLYGTVETRRAYDNRARRVVAQAATSMDVFHGKPEMVESADVLQIGVTVLEELDERIGIARGRLAAVETMRTIFDRGGALAIEDRLTAARAQQLRQTEAAIGGNAKNAGEIISKSQTQIAELNARSARVSNAANLLMGAQSEFIVVAENLIALQDREVRDTNTVTTQIQQIGKLDGFLSEGKARLAEAESHLALATVNGGNIDQIQGSIADLRERISAAEKARQDALLAKHVAEADLKKLSEDELPTPAKRMVELRSFVKGRVAEGLGGVLPSNVFAHNNEADYGHLDNFSLPQALQNFQGNVDRLRRDYERATTDATADQFSHRDYITMLNLAVSVFQEHRVHVDALKQAIIGQMTLSGIKMVADSHATLAESAHTWATTHTAQIAEGAMVRSDVGTELNRIADVCRGELQQLEAAKLAVSETAHAHSSAAKTLQTTLENQREVEALQSDFIAGKAAVTKRRGRMILFGKKHEINVADLNPEDYSEADLMIAMEAATKFMVANDAVSTKRAKEFLETKITGVAERIKDSEGHSAARLAIYRGTAEKHAAAIRAAATAGHELGAAATEELQAFIGPFRKLDEEITASDGKVLAEMIGKKQRQEAGQVLAEAVLAVGGTPGERVVAAWQVLTGRRPAAVAGRLAAKGAVASLVALEAAATNGKGNGKK